MSASFNKIVKNITNSKKVYRNEFIEPYEPPDQSSQYNVPRNLSHLPTEQQEDLMNQVVKDLKSRGEDTNTKIEALTEKATEEVLTEKESNELIYFCDELTKIETQISNITKDK